MANGAAEVAYSAATEAASSVTEAASSALGLQNDGEDPNALALAGFHASRADLNKQLQARTTSLLPLTVGRCEIERWADSQLWNCELLGILSFMPGFQVAYKITFYPNAQKPNPPLCCSFSPFYLLLSDFCAILTQTLSNIN